jgi:serine/threonine-protein kinase
MKPRVADWLLVCSLLPIWLATFVLHVRQSARTGLAQPAFFVVTPRSATDYPRVGGFRPEQGGADAAAGLEEGDLILRAGTVDTRGVGNVGFDAIAIGQADENLSVPLVHSRGGGLPQETRVRLSSTLVWWMRIPPLLTLALAALVVFWRGQDREEARAFFLTFVLVLILETPFHGGRYAQTVLSKWIFYALGVVVPPLLFMWALRFPREAPRPTRTALAVCWGFAPLAGFVRGSYLFGGPLPLSIAPYLGPAIDALMVVTCLGILTYRYRLSSPIGKRRIKWLLWGGYVGGLPTLTVLSFPLAGVVPSGYRAALAFAAVAFCAMPLGVLLAAVRQQLFDVDKVLSATASYYTFGVFLFAGLLTSVPPLTQSLTDLLSIPPPLSHFSVSLLIAGIVFGAHRSVRPWLDRVFFPERQALELGVQKLLEGLQGHPSLLEMARAVGEQFQALIRPQRTLVFGRSGDVFEPLFIEGDVQPRLIPLTDPLIAVLQQRSDPVTSAGESLSPFERASLESLQVSVLAPIRGPEGLAAFIGLGPKRSGDIYTSSDLARLALVAERMSAELMYHASGESPRKPALASQALREIESASAGFPRQDFETTRTLPAARALADTAAECPDCGLCVSGEHRRCPNDGAGLQPQRFPLLLDQRFRLQRRLGRGGMGTVYEAQDESLERRVAVKLVRAELAERHGAVERFRKEAKATAAFTHTNVVTVHEFGVAAERWPYMVMELLRGTTLREELRGGRLSVARALHVLKGVCAGVDAAHRRRFVHRDLKPENVFLVDEDATTVPKILDFGLAKALSAALPVQLESHGGGLAGTLHYMAPERFVSRTAHTGWDIWSLAVIAYELLGGARPFEGETVLEVEQAILTRELPPLSSRCPEARPSWNAFFENALARDPHRRHASARVFYEALEQTLSS